MKHQPIMTDEKKLNIIFSTQYIAIMAEVIKLEHATVLVDAYFKTPLANNFAKRILSDAKDIQAAIRRNDRLGYIQIHADAIEEYAAALWGINHYFIGLPVTQINEVLAGLKNAKIEAEINENTEQSDLYRAVYDTIDYGLQGAEIENKPREEGIKNAANAILDMVGHHVKEATI